MNIFSFVLKSKNINSESYTEASNVDLNKNYKFIILDNDLETEKKEIFLKKINLNKINTKLILAVSKNYNETLTNTDLNLYKGIIYKPFDIEEIIEIATND